MNDSEHFAAADGRVYHHTDEAMRNPIGIHNGDGTFARTDLAVGMGGLSLDPAAQLAAVRAQQAAAHAAAQQGGAQGGAQQGGGGAAAAVRDDEAEESSDEDGAAKWSAEAEDALARQDAAATAAGEVDEAKDRAALARLTRTAKQNADGAIKAEATAAGEMDNLQMLIPDGDEDMILAIMDALVPSGSVDEAGAAAAAQRRRALQRALVSAFKVVDATIDAKVRRTKAERQAELIRRRKEAQEQRQAARRGSASAATTLNNIISRPARRRQQSAAMIAARAKFGLKGGAAVVVDLLVCWLTEHPDADGGGGGGDDDDEDDVLDALAAVSEMLTAEIVAEALEQRERAEAAEAEVLALKEAMRAKYMDMLLATEGRTRAQKAKATEEMKNEAQKEMEALKMEAAEGVVEGAAEAM